MYYAYAMAKNYRRAHLVYPHQLFRAEYIPSDTDVVVVVEEPLFFGNDHQFSTFFHKQKLILHRASMRRYVEEVLWPAGFDVDYVQANEINESGDIIQRIVECERVTVFDVCDDVLNRRLLTAARTIPDAPALHILDTPNFYLSHQEVKAFFADKAKSQFANFYQWQRERWNILISADYKPVGDSWCLDEETAKRLPKDTVLPTFEVFGSNDYVDEARQYVEKMFSDNPGQTDEFCWATNHEEAERWLFEFLENRLDDYSTYRQSIDGQVPWAYHSMVSVYLNVGLLSPKQVVDSALERHHRRPVPLASLEGFIRQILGWREFVRGVYANRHVQMRTSNVFKSSRKLTRDWYQGTTGLPPVDDLIRKVQKRAYAHNIERMMVIGNIMLICEIHPDEVNRWFSELLIDAYDWSLIPFVYGLSQYADGGSISVKPGFSSSNFILSVSNYHAGEWCDVWDGLYWRFVERHQDKLAKNPHTKLIVGQLKRISPDRLRIINYRAEDFLKSKTSL
jgi:deoxyribodipyrimidine photolyase-related protein